LRLYGDVPPELRERVVQRWLNLLPPALAATVDHLEFFG
jgi:hypothetical protein